MQGIYGEFFSTVPGSSLWPPSSPSGVRYIRDIDHAEPLGHEAVRQKTAGLDAPIRAGRTPKLRREGGSGLQIKKTSTLPKGELRIAPCFLGPQSRSLAASARDSVITLQAGLLTSGSFLNRRLPHPRQVSGILPVSSPVTAAGP